MANLTFADSHNIVAYLEKSVENADFAEIVDFLNANTIRKTKRKATKISQSSGPTTPVTDETIYKEREDGVERAATTAASLDAAAGQWRQDTILRDRPAQTRFERLSKRSHKLPLSRVNTLRSGEDRFGDYSSKEDSQEVGKKRKSRTSQLKRSAPITTIGVSISTTEPSTPPTTTTTTTFIKDESLTIAHTLMKMKSEKLKEKAKERGSKENSSKTTTRPTKGVIMREASETTTRPTVPPQQKLDPKDKGKDKMVKPEKPLKSKDQKSKENGLLKKGQLFIELMNKRKKHFVRLRAKENRRKPPTKAQKRNQMCTYLKNMDGFTHNQLKNKSFEEVQKDFDNTMSWINSFVSMDSKVVKDRAEGSEIRAEGSSKRA
nr:hypothetical protein [Tanacetum cinerariifolium]